MAPVVLPLSNCRVAQADFTGSGVGDRPVLPLLDPGRPEFLNNLCLRHSFFSVASSLSVLPRRCWRRDIALEPDLLRTAAGTKPI
jgi:hypothetical protein